MAKSATVRWKSVGLKEEERLTAGLVHHRAPAWSADGRWLAMRAGDHDSAWVVVDRRGRVARVLPGVAGGGASFSPDGALAFGRKTGASCEIWMASAPAAPPVRLLGGDGKIYHHPAYAPDGKHLAFACAEDAEAPLHLFLLELATGARVALPHDAGRSDAWPQFAPETSELFFEGSLLDGEVGCFALGPDRREPVRIDGTAPSKHPAPLSSELVIVERPLADGAQLVLIDRRDGRERELSVDEPRLRDLREPAVWRSRSGKLKLAFAAVVREEGVLPRFDVCAGRLKGLSFEGDSELDDPAGQSAGESPPSP